MIGALLGTRTVRWRAPSAGLRAGESWDEDRVALFDALFAALHKHSDRSSRTGTHQPQLLVLRGLLLQLHRGNGSSPWRRPRRSSSRRAIPVDRPQDRTTSLARSPRQRPCPAWQVTDRRRRPGLAAEAPRADHGGTTRTAPRPLQDQAQPGRQHRVRRPQPRPGHAETRLQRYGALAPGFPRVVFAMFLVAEAHPFADLNGRVASACERRADRRRQQRLMIPMSSRLSPGPARDAHAAHRVDQGPGACAGVGCKRRMVLGILVQDRPRAYAALLTPAEAEEQGVILRTTVELADAAPKTETPAPQPAM